MRETTALGAAIAAGLAAGVWHNFAELRDINRAGGAVFEPQITREDSATKFSEWEKAVQMSRGWIGAGNVERSSNGVHPGRNATAVRSNENRDLPTSKPALSQTAPPLISEIISEGYVGNTMKTKAPAYEGEQEFSTIKSPIFSISSDLDDADEEDLFLELRKMEILQKIKNLRRMKLNYF